MIEIGSLRKNILAIIGPTIQQHSYEIGNDLAIKIECTAEYKSKNNINIKLNPLILDFMANSREISKIDITNSEYSILFDMFDNFSTENIKKIFRK